MDAPAMATGSLPAARAGLGLMTYPPKIGAVRQARRYVQDAVATSATPALAEDAALLVAELAVNAVLHARTDFDVAVEGTADGVRVSVRDRSPAMPVLAAPSATAMSGRGLELVAALASRWGVAPSASTSKSVWFELSGGCTGSGGAPSSAASRGTREGGEGINDLLVTGAGAGGGCQRIDGVAVVLPALEAADLLGAEEAVQDVLRELQLVLLSETRTAGHASRAGCDTDRGDLESTTDIEHWAGREPDVAYRLDRAARDFSDVRAQVRQQVSRAVAVGQQYVALSLRLDPGVERRASAFAAALEAAEELAARGGLLSAADALARHRAVRRAYLLEVVAAASCL